MKPKIYLLSLGCPRNLVDSEVLTALLKKKGFSFTEDFNKSGIIIINTCAFIESAKQESIDAILKAVSLKKEERRYKKLVVAGCLAQRYPGELTKEIPQIDGIFGTSDFIKIPDFLTRQDKIKSVNVSESPNFLYDHKFKRTFITPPHYAYIKVQEGCLNNCSYCAIPKLRGPYRSRSFDSLMKEAASLAKMGIKEINLIGQDTTLYGIDRYGRSRIGELLKKLSGIMKGRWIRLLYTHPAHYNDDLIDIVAGEEPVCKYLDIPIQHVNDKMLEIMNRKTTKKDIIDLIEKLRKKIPNIAIRTTIMVGFPGETDKAFEELLMFVKDIKFERLGLFIYSREEGTKAYNFKDLIPDDVAEGRYNKILELQQTVSKEKNNLCLGKIFRVLLDEKIDKGHTQYLGRTHMDAPEVDGTCYVRSRAKLETGKFYNVKITDTLEYDFVGEAL